MAQGPRRRTKWGQLSPGHSWDTTRGENRNSPVFGLLLLVAENLPSSFWFYPVHKEHPSIQNIKVVIFGLFRAFPVPRSTSIDLNPYWSTLLRKDDTNSNLFLLQVRLREAENEDTIRKLREKLEEVEEERRREREQQPAAPVASLQASCP